MNDIEKPGTTDFSPTREKEKDEALQNMWKPQELTAHTEYGVREYFSTLNRLNSWLAFGD